MTSSSTEAPALDELLADLDALGFHYITLGHYPDLDPGHHWNVTAHRPARSDEEGADYATPHVRDGEPTTWTVAVEGWAEDQTDALTAAVVAARSHAAASGDRSA